MAKPSIQELATRHVQLKVMGAYTFPKHFHKNQKELEEYYYEARTIYDQLLARVGYDQTKEALQKATEIYKLLVPSDPAQTLRPKGNPDDNDQHLCVHGHG